MGTAWHNRGHDVTFGVRNPDDPRYASLGTVRANEAAPSDAEVVVLCTPWQGTQEAVQGCGDISGKILIDATNPLSPDFSTLEVGLTTSGAKQVPDWSARARVCKAMNQIGAPMMDRPQLADTPMALRRGLGTDFGFGLLRGRA